MAQSVNTCTTKAGKHLGILLMLGLLASAACAESLRDPTRPTGTSIVDNEAENVMRGPVLQSVLNSSGRKLAIISGQTVKQGDMIGNARVVNIRDAEVVLAQGKELQVLKLFPVVEKKPSTARPTFKNGMRQ
jgi:MSHA biogenesis protein MshK